MKSIFTNPPHGRYDMGRFGFPVPHPVLSAKIQRRSGMGVNIEDILETVGVSEANIVKLLDQLPLSDQSAFKVKLEECKRQGVASVAGAKCLYDLFQEVKAYLKSRGETTVTPMPLPQVSAPATPFPIVPVALGVAAAGALVYFLATRGN